jgi:hypothetical protein
VLLLHAAQAEGFSDSIISSFFCPFLGGIFFDRQLRTSSRLFQFVMRTLATGSNCLPAGGIGAVAQQLANHLPAESIVLQQRAAKVGDGPVIVGSCWLAACQWRM